MNDLSALFSQLEIKYPLDRYELIIRQKGSYRLAIHEIGPVSLTGADVKGQLVRSIFASTLERGLSLLLSGGADEAAAELMQIIEPNPAGKTGQTP